MSKNAKKFICELEKMLENKSKQEKLLILNTCLQLLGGNK